MKRVVVGWSYTNTILFVKLKDWNLRDTQVVTSRYSERLRAISKDAEVWCLGPWHMYDPIRANEIRDTLELRGITFQWGNTDTLMGVPRNDL